MQILKLIRIARHMHRKVSLLLVRHGGKKYEKKQIRLTYELEA